MKVLVFVIMSFFGLAMMAQDGDGKTVGSKSNESTTVTTTEGTTLDNNTIIIIAVVGGVVLLGIIAMVARNKNSNR